MLLQHTISKLPLHHHHHHHHHHSQTHAPSLSSSSLSYLITFPSGLSTKKLIPPNKNPIFTCSSSSSSAPSRGYVYGSTLDYEKRPMPKWNGIFRKLTMMEDPQMGCVGVLNQWENRGKRLAKWELCRVVKELRKFRKFDLALEVYQWMSNRSERFRITTSDTAIQLDLVAKVHGILAAEEYFLKLPPVLKDGRVHGALLNAYVRASMKEKAESLMDEMRSRGYVVHALPFNVMMTLYMNLRDYGRVELMVSEMMERKIPFDICSYNIWITSLGSQGSLEKMEQVFEKLTLDASVMPGWTTFSTMATMYIKLEQLEKAEKCLKELESKIVTRERVAYHYLISLYGTVGRKEEVMRIWDAYKSIFPKLSNWGYHSVISSLVRLGYIEDAERIYGKWVQVQTYYDSRVPNLLLGWYARNDLSPKADALFNQMIEAGAKPNSMTWEILAEGHIRQRKISEALSCLKNAASAEGSNSWKPKPANVCSVLKLCEQEADVENKEALLQVLKQVGCMENEAYMSFIPVSNNSFSGSESTIEKGDTDDEGEAANMLLTQLQGSL